MFGNHVFGTHTLDYSGSNEILLRNGASAWEDRFTGFTASLLPIKRHLPLANKGSEIFHFYCLSYKRVLSNAGGHLSNLHIYAKEMVYAYRQLIKTTNTNFLELGQVRFFIDKRCLDVVMPYCKSAGLESLVIPFDSDKNVDYSAYMQFFDFKLAPSVKYVMYTDTDEFWTNPKGVNAFDFQDAITRADDLQCDILSRRAPESLERVSNDLYNRYIASGEEFAQYNEDRLNKKKEYVMKEFGEELPQILAESSITGRMQMVKPGSISSLICDYYNECGDLFRCDEALWCLFIAKHKCKVGDIPINFHYNEQAALYPVGVYHFEHIQVDRFTDFNNIYNDVVSEQGL